MLKNFRHTLDSQFPQLLEDERKVLHTIIPEVQLNRGQRIAIAVKSTRWILVHDIVYLSTFQTQFILDHTRIDQREKVIARSVQIPVSPI